MDITPEIDLSKLVGRSLPPSRVESFQPYSFAHYARHTGYPGHIIL
jgi:hypothetical protein